MRQVPCPLTSRVFRRLVLIFALGAASTPLFGGGLDREIARVEQIRGVKFVRGVERVTIRRSALGERLRVQLARSLPYSLEEYVATLRALHLLEQEGDSTTQLLTLLEQQVLAFYDPLTHTYYDIDSPPTEAAAMVPPSLIAIHELTHALQDQRFAIGARDRDLRDDWDAALAYHAVIEGEATLVMMAALVEGVAPLDVIVDNDALLSRISEAAQSDLLVAPGAPRYFVESLKFPYLAGLRLVMQAYKRGGWKAVDGLHENPPRSTREVLHPEEYFARAQTRVSVPHAGSGARQPADSLNPPDAPGVIPFAVQELGEFHWSFLLGQENARGLRTDRVAIVHDAFCQPTVLVNTSWDSTSQARAFRNAYTEFLASREPFARVVQDGALVRAAYGADAALIETFVSGTRNEEHGTRNMERGTRNDEHGTWNAERRTQNDERSTMNER